VHILKPFRMIVPHTSQVRPMARQILDYSSEDGSRSKGRILVCVAAAFCVSVLFLGFVYFGYAALPGLIAFVLGVFAYLRRRRVAQRNSLDLQIKIFMLFGLLCTIPTAVEIWITSPWAQPASSYQADELMDRGEYILDACKQFAADHGGAFPKDLVSLVRSGRLSPRLLNRNMRVNDLSNSTDNEIEGRSDYLYYGGDLDGTWIPSHRVIVLLSKEQFNKYGGYGRVVGYVDVVGFCHNRDLPDILSACNRERALHGLPPIAP